TDVGTLLLALAVLGGVLSVALGLAGGSQIALIARSVVVVVATGALIAENVMGRRDPTEAHPAALLAAPIVATIAALTALVLGHARTPSALTLAGVVAAIVAGTVWAMARAARPLDDEREQIEAALAQTAHRVVGDETAPARAIDVRPGEEIVIE